MVLDCDHIDVPAIIRAQQGDEEALSCLSRVVTEQVTTYLYRLTLDHHLAQDLCQETLLRLLKHLPQLQIDQADDLWAWLRRAALSRVQDHHRRNVRRQTRYEETMKRQKSYESIPPEPPEALVQRELGQAIWQAMSRLALHYRNILTLRCLDALSYAQIAEVTGQTQLQARLLFFRAKKSLKQELGKQGVQPSDLVKALVVFAGVTLAGGRTKTAAASVTAAYAEVGWMVPMVGTFISKLGIALVTLATLGVMTIATVPLIFPSPIERGQTTRLSPAVIQQIDRKILGYLNRYDFLNVALVDDANTVFVSSYGRGAGIDAVIPSTGATPFIATLVLQLFEQGLIQSLDDPIERYCESFSDLLPQRFTDTPLTFRHLLTHTSGLVAGPGKDDQPVWQAGKLNLRFRPGTDVWLSDTNYALLETACVEMTGKDLDELLDEYIEAPVQASSFAALEPEDPTVAGVCCTVEDVAKFVGGLLKGQYISKELLQQEMWRAHRINYGMGWYLLISDVEPLKDQIIGIFHLSDSNSRYECLIHLNRTVELETYGAVVLGLRKEGAQYRSSPNLQLPIDLATIL